MQLDPDPDLERFRSELRDFIAEHAPVIEAVTRWGVRAPEPSDIAALRTWTALLYSHDYIGAEWPTEWGGRGKELSPAHRAAVAEELALAQAPLPLGAGLLASAALIHFGSAEQQARYLARIRTAEDVWCQLFSEPEAGSDLANLQTRATRDGDVFRISGQKVWTTNGQHAQMGYLLARTNIDGAKQAGITAFAVDMSSSGIDVRPLREITGTADFNEVFFDQVEVPAANVIGDVDDGWRVATASLALERSTVGGGSVALLRAIRRAADVASTRESSGAGDATVWRELGRLYAAIRVTTHLSAFNTSKAAAGKSTPADGAMAKLLFSETNVELMALGVELQELEGLLTSGDPRSPSEGWWQDAWLYSRTYTIAGGTSEIMRNLIAERGLGLPREPRG